MSIKMCFWVEPYMFFVLHDYYDINIIFFVYLEASKKKKKKKKKKGVQGVRHYPFTFPM